MVKLRYFRIMSLLKWVTLSYKHFGGMGEESDYIEMSG